MGPTTPCGSAPGPAGAAGGAEASTPGGGLNEAEAAAIAW